MLRSSTRCAGRCSRRAAGSRSVRQPKRHSHPKRRCHPTGTPAMTPSMGRVPFLTHAVRVRVPATSANLGPGFDSLGLALALDDELAARVTDGGIRVTVTGHGAADLPTGEDHLVVATMMATFDRLDARPTGLDLTCRNRIPHARGLGSSSAAI